MWPPQYNGLPFLRPPPKNNMAFLLPPPPSALPATLKIQLPLLCNICATSIQSLLLLHTAMRLKIHLQCSNSENGYEIQMRRLRRGENIYA